MFVEARTRKHRSIAKTVRVQHALVGIIKAVARDGRTPTVLGQTVIMHRATICGCAAPTLRLRAGMDIRVSALPSAPGRWQATRVTRLKKPRSKDIPFLIRGPLKTVRRHTLRLGRHLFLSTAHSTPPPGSYVLALGYYRSGYAIITRVQPPPVFHRPAVGG